MIDFQEQNRLMKLFFEKVVSFDGLVEIRPMIVSEGAFYKSMRRYCKDYTSLISGIKDLSKNSDVNIYFGINPRDKEGGKDSDVLKRRLFYFDIEAAGKKPKIVEGELYHSLLDKSISHVIYHMQFSYGMMPVACICSGRGYHLYYGMSDFKNDDESKAYFSLWFKRVSDEIEKELFGILGNYDEMEKTKIDRIKVSDSVFNASRIAGMPLTQHRKYEDKPLRNLLYVYPDNIYNGLYDKIKKEIGEIKTTKRKEGMVKIRKTYNDDTIWNCPELKLITDYDNLPEGQLHSRILFAFKMLCRDNEITCKEKLQDHLISLGYNEVLDWETISPDFQYTRMTLVNWCITHYRWCMENGYDIPYDYPDRNAKCSMYEESDDIFDWKDAWLNYSISSMKDLIYFIQCFLGRFTYDGGRTMFYHKALLHNIYRYADDKMFIDFIVKQGIFDRIKMMPGIAPPEKRQS